MLTYISIVLSKLSLVNLPYVGFSHSSNLFIAFINIWDLKILKTCKLKNASINIINIIIN
jgi:hypothetical protein